MSVPAWLSPLPLLQWVSVLAGTLGSPESESVTCSVMSDSAVPWTVALQAPLSVEFFRKEYWSGSPCPSPRDLPDPGIEPRSPALQADFLLSEPLSESESCLVVSTSVQPHRLYSPWNSPGQNTEVGSLSFLQGIFPTKELNPGLLHCRRILYQLSHKGSYFAQ